MGRRKLSRDQKRASKKRKLAYLKKNRSIQYAEQKQWLLKLRLLSEIKPPKITWPKTNDVSWETLPSLIEALDKDGVLASQLKGKEVQVWDPCFHDGMVASTWKRVGVSVQHTREDFWRIWQ